MNGSPASGMRKLTAWIAAIQPALRATPSEPARTLAGHHAAPPRASAR